MKALSIPETDNEPVLLTIEEARAMLRVGRFQFQYLRDEGLIETVRLGRSVRVVAESVRTLPARLPKEDAA